MSKYEGMDLRFTIPNISSINQYVMILADHQVKSGVSGCRIKIGSANYLHDGNRCGEVAVYAGEDQYPQESFVWVGNLGGVVRILMHGNFVTIYLNNRWIYTFYRLRCDYATVPNIRFKPNYAVTITDVRNVELYDWREAVYIDIDSSPASGISSVIQERPVDILGKSDGSIAFYYTPQVRDTLSISSTTTRNHAIRYGGNSQAASDTIVYFRDVITYIDPTSAKDIGLNTRILRVPNLDYGAERAAGIKVLQARQQREMHQIQARFHPALEVGDKLDVSYTLPGTGRNVVESCIPERVSYVIRTGSNEMSIEGRSAAVTYSPTPRSS